MRDPWFAVRDPWFAVRDPWFAVRVEASGGPGGRVQVTRDVVSILTIYYQLMISHKHIQRLDSLV